MLVAVAAGAPSAPTRMLILGQRHLRAILAE
jgi:hypothetical protein